MNGHSASSAADYGRDRPGPGAGRSGPPNADHGGLTAATVGPPTAIDPPKNRAAKRVSRLPRTCDLSGAGGEWFVWIMPREPGQRRRSAGSWRLICGGPTPGR